MGHRQWAVTSAIPPDKLTAAVCVKIILLPVILYLLSGQATVCFIVSVVGVNSSHPDAGRDVCVTTLTGRSYIEGLFLPY